MTLILLLAMFHGGQVGFEDPRPYTPNDTVLFALSDVQATQDAETLKTYRYLSLANFPAAVRAEKIHNLNFVLNSLSRRQSVVYVQPIAGSNNTVVRVDLHQLRMSPSAWDTLAAKGSGPVRVSLKQDQPEPYYTLNLNELLTGDTAGSTTKTKKVQRKDANGELLYAGGDITKPIYDDVAITEAKGLVAGTWFDITTYRALQTATCTSYPILRADWFVANASLAPAYNELLGIKTLDDFHNLVRYRSADDDLAGRAVVANSQLVSLYQRGIMFTPKTNGTYWQTFDYLKSSGLNNLLKDPLSRKRDAGEVFAELPNGLQAFSLIDGNNKIIDVADGNIVTDQNGPWRHTLVWNGLYSCTNCHKNGAQDLLDEVRPLSTAPSSLMTKKQKGFEDFVDQYTKNMEAELASTRVRYALAIGTATGGRKPEDNTTKYAQMFVEYWQKPVTMKEAAAEVGCTPNQLSGILGRIIGPDPAITTLLRGRPLRRDLWEAAFSQAATSVYKDLGKK